MVYVIKSHTQRSKSMAQATFCCVFLHPYNKQLSRMIIYCQFPRRVK